LLHPLTGVRKDTILIAHFPFPHGTAIALIFPPSRLLKEAGDRNIVEIKIIEPWARVRKVKYELKKTVSSPGSAGFSKTQSR